MNYAVAVPDAYTLNPASTRQSITQSNTGVLIVLQEEVLKEAEACVIDAKRRLGGALQDLESLVDEHGETLAENPDMVEAKALLEANPAPEN